MTGDQRPKRKYVSMPSTLAEEDALCARLADYLKRNPGAKVSKAVQSVFDMDADTYRMQSTSFRQYCRLLCLRMGMESGGMVDATWGRRQAIEAGSGETMPSHSTEPNPAEPLANPKPDSDASLIYYQILAYFKAYPNDTCAGFMRHHGFKTASTRTTEGARLGVQCLRRIRELVAVGYLECTPGSTIRFRLPT